MIHHFIIGGFLIGVTVIFQAICFDMIMRLGERTSGWFAKFFPFHWKSFFIAAMVLGVMCVGVVQMWIWAFVYLWLGALTDLHTAIYFSIESFTTVGYGDVVLTPEWRLLGSIESANGFLLFGWSAAFIFEIVSQLYRKEARAIKTKEG